MKVAQLCPTLYEPMDYAIHGILQGRILESVAFPFSRGSSRARNRTRVSCIAGGFFTNWTMRKGQESLILLMAFIDFLVLPGTVLNTLHKLAHMFFISNSYLACIQEKKKKKNLSSEMSMWDSHNIRKRFH